MRIEFGKKVYTPEIVSMPPKKSDKDTVVIEVPKKTAKRAAMLTAALLSLASAARAEVYRSYVDSSPDSKCFSQANTKTLHLINENDEVVDHAIKDGVQNSQVVGIVRYGLPISAGVLFLLLTYNLIKKTNSEIEVDDKEDKMAGYASWGIDHEED